MVTKCCAMLGNGYIFVAGNATYKSLCRSVGPSVRLSHFTFFFRKVAYRVACARLMAIDLVSVCAYLCIFVCSDMLSVF